MKIKFKKPSLIVTACLINVLTFTGWNLLRVMSGWIQRETLAEYGAPMEYIIGSGAAWMLIGLVAAALLLFQTPHTHAVLASSASAYFVWYWIDRAAVRVSPNPNLPAMLIISGLWLAITFVESYLLQNSIAKERE
jgi:hypothetical protein